MYNICILPLVLCTTMNWFYFINKLYTHVSQFQIWFMYITLGCLCNNQPLIYPDNGIAHRILNYICTCSWSHFTWICYKREENTIATSVSCSHSMICYMMITNKHNLSIWDYYTLKYIIIQITLLHIYKHWGKNAYQNMKQNAKK